ncbi:disulfide bond formation protein DsbE [Aggregatibacter actinomycetemcomitans]|uniref:Disulfide bond formation protein DsbE n=1 Tax=Aggregatibacter actinomycetemcomitans TaxID=714 RepID=A0A5D0ENM4_AGGAC|nr:DsbE family thiol:disulfide interchange protein [Aggregatibacter actinomycetemcomitans]AFI87672.1 thiol:disulfide interchange protein DsbE [Aggregatibacter actinomycetemcomitans D7S-1]AMQ93586.1 disulfide bond formation protein DsbE [Aggregatibacter actinomycetemcomitans]EKX93999.1 periplasmic protein thiol:disulfide oxidoreductase, DsbE subfamily [Aggregatibacter actinomycetemcomitans Y4]KND83724.1 thiol:disulfide interchange protein DsbE [Aggregatibacter actinomycetemcomitans serotype a st
MNRKVIFFLPLILLLGVCVLLLAGLHQDPKEIAFALIDKPVPEFYQVNLLDNRQTLSPRDFPKRPFLINIWGSWCGYCQQEHPLLMELAQEIPIVGVDYRDKPQNGIEMLQRMGNPYALVIDDSRGELALKLGVDGAPETYLVDADGIIRYRHSGLLDRETWQNTFVPQLNWLMQP